MDDAAAQRNASQLDELVADTSALSATLKRRIKALEKQGGSGRDGQIRKQQVSPFLFRQECPGSECWRIRLHLSSLNLWRRFKIIRLSNNKTAKSTSNEWKGSSKSVRYVYFFACRFVPDKSVQ
jgi:hypothetical protein